eukprot:CAMPEP_0118803424 /NCGR_PEP_ID=MMETSP1161-20130426/17101_1 /TAXON_ID=249345 /ORGANISM="Picochlorum oklahomensis, Strain CCMP2329" /LENGTH=873 /DNA_ID=CAMNT_0006731935 /DNA_START=205 /DNA_END=2826 /DNA_ORIENTATION=+
MNRQQPPPSVVVRMRIEDVLTEEVVAEMRDQYLNVEKLIMMLQQFPLTPEEGGDANGGSNVVLNTLQRVAHCQDSKIPFEDIYLHSVVISQFIEDIVRVNRTVQQRVEFEWSRSVQAALQLHGALDKTEQSDDVNGSRQTIKSIRSCLDSISQAVESTDTFTRHNVVLGDYVARCLDGQHDQCTTSRAEYIAAVESIVKHGTGIESLLMALSDMYQAVRVLETHGRNAKEALHTMTNTTWKAPNTFTRVTKKFWILPRNVTRFKLHVMRHLPILVYGERSKIMDVPVRQLQDTRPEPSIKDFGSISSVYLDSVPALEHYHDRLHRRDKASVIRLRWYGDRDPDNGDETIFVERKVHRNAYTGLTSSKERGSIPQRHVGDLLRGQYHNKEAKDAVFLSSAATEIAEQGQEPLMRTSYQRTAFQNSTENTVRISLDTGLCMSKEYPTANSVHWCRDGAYSYQRSDVEEFSYGVVEIKLQSKPPQWVVDLVKTGMLLIVPKFSKFLHGTASLYQEYAENVPYWFLPDPEDKTRLTTANWDEMADKEDVFAKHAADWLFPVGFGEPVEEEKHLKLAFFNPKRVFGAKSSAQHKTRQERQQIQIEEALGEINDESGNRTWCDTEQVTNHQELLVQQDDKLISPHQDIDSNPRRSWPIYQTLTDNEEASTSSDQTTSNGFSSDSAHRKPYARELKNVCHDVEACVDTQRTTNQIISKKSNDESYAIKQYTMASSEQPAQNQENHVKRTSSLVRTRVEPKTFFANERTFLQWINISVLVMFLALSLLSGSSLAPGLGSSLTNSCNSDDSKCLAGKMSGAIIAPVALCFMAYALFMYKKRTIQILRRETVRYDDQRGPVILVVILLLAMTISYILTMIYIF